MLECKKYRYDELTEYLKTSTVQATDRKLQSYDVQFTRTGRGAGSVYNITAINDPFRVYAVFELGASPQTDFKKLADFVYLILNDDAFKEMNPTMMEDYLKDKKLGIARQTLAKYIELLEKNNLISKSQSECVYYRVKEKDGVLKRESVSFDEYKMAWQVFWNCVNNGYDRPSAFCAMRKSFGGTPQKCPTIELNAFYIREYNWLNEILVKDFGN